MTFTILDRNMTTPAVCATPVYCSERCWDRSSWRRRDYRRRARCKGGSGTSVAELIERDGPACYLCGGLVDMDDYEITDEGYSKVGPMCPSVDHVVPLSKGGIDDLGNAKLAHHICNSLKSDKPLAEFKLNIRLG